ncbi:MAG: hypothetical protein GY870_22675 [archaeon]|nr:hypothetical protein [archaeon]
MKTFKQFFENRKEKSTKNFIQKVLDMWGEKKMKGHTITRLSGIGVKFKVDCIEKDRSSIIDKNIFSYNADHFCKWCYSSKKLNPNRGVSKNKHQNISI